MSASPEEHGTVRRGLCNTTAPRPPLGVSGSLPSPASRSSPWKPEGLQGCRHGPGHWPHPEQPPRALRPSKGPRKPAVRVSRGTREQSVHVCPRVSTDTPPPGRGAPRAA